jgi:hypothetical protein
VSLLANDATARWPNHHMWRMFRVERRNSRFLYERDFVVPRA